MKHYVLLKLADGVDAVKVQEKIWKTYQKLDDELDWMNHPVILPGCRETKSTYDLMAVVTLDAEEQLTSFVNHPLYVKLTGELKDKIAKKATFDHY